MYLACEDGFFGTNCALECRYPTFGNQCQSVCTCDFQNCDHVNGCIRYTKSKQYSQTIIYKMYNLLLKIINIILYYK